MQQRTIESFFEKEPITAKPITQFLPSTILHEDNNGSDQIEPEPFPSKPFKSIDSQNGNQESTQAMTYFDPRLSFQSQPVPTDNTHFIWPERPLMHDGQNVDTQNRSIKDFFATKPKRSGMKQFKDENTMSTLPPKSITPKTSVGKTNYKTDHNFLENWLSKDAKNKYSWKYLPYELMRKVMAFLSLEDNARLASVCRYWAKSYKSIWLSYDYFQKLSFKDMKETEVSKIFENGGRLPHIKKMKQMMCGKKVGSFLKKSQLSTQISGEFKQGQKLFEKFSVEPSKPNFRVLIFDKDVEDICQSSRFSLLYIKLISCNLLTSRSFSAIAKCKNLQFLTLKMCAITDSDVRSILTPCNGINKLALCSCFNLTDQVIEIICQLLPQIETLELSSNIKIQFNNLTTLSQMEKLRKFVIENSNLISDHFIVMAKYSKLRIINVQGSKKLENSFLTILGQYPIINYLEKLHIGKNNNFTEEAVFNFVEQTNILIEINFPLMSERISQKLHQNTEKENYE